MRFRQLWFVALGGVCMLACGCAALTSATSGVKSAQDGVKGVQDTAKSAEDDTKKGIEDSKKKGAEAQGKGGTGPDGKPCPKDNTDPDCDGIRPLAKPSEANEIINDEVGVAKNDTNDWKKFTLKGRPGLVKVKIRWDDPKANINIDLYDAFGTNVATSPGKQREPEKKLLAQLSSTGIYYIKVAAVGIPGSIYTMQLEWAGAPQAAAAAEAPPAAPAGAQVPPPGGAVAAPGAPAAAPPPAGALYPTAEDPSHPRCRVVQSYRGEDGQMVLYLDRGSDAKFRAGMTGTLLIGKDGDLPLDGGGFKITQVIDKQKSIAKSAVSRVGANNRARVDLVPWKPPGVM